ncbi:hypothetical protein [Halomarina pelagica]|uniref:hypothetical protein n=1 Tax=Halomarina pelagica TaxID=2961599 RepID=UPI0020C45E79|nr:hypothetical protein [Halomarina sp. BND7]
MTEHVETTSGGHEEPGGSRGLGGRDEHPQEKEKEKEKEKERGRKEEEEEEKEGEEKEEGKTDRDTPRFR